MPEKYQYYATSRFGTRQINPVAALKLSWEKDSQDNRNGFQKKISNSLICTGDDFKWFYALEQTTYRCEFVPVTISKYCNGGYIDSWLSGTINYNQAKWDLDECKVEFELEIADKYSCYENNKDIKKNLLTLALGSRQTITLTGGTPEYYSCTRSYVSGGGVIEDPSPCPQPDGSGWTMYKQRIEINYTGPSAGRTEYIDFIRYNLGGGLYAPGIVYAPVYTYTSDASGSISLIEYKIIGADDGITTIDNGIKLKEVMEYFISAYCPDITLKSDFFQWNPDLASTINYVTGLASKVLNLIIFQKSDVKRPNVSNNATIAEITFEELLSDICTIFNLKWDIIGTKFIIEHYSWWARSAGLDLTAAKYKKWMLFKRKYSYDADSMPKYEKFSFMESGGADFKGRDIYYESACVNNTKSGKKEYPVENITTDVGLVLANPDPDSSQVEDDGFVLVACTPGNVVISEAGILTGDVQLNNSLAWAQLHRDYHKYGRVLQEGFMNGQLTQFISSIKTKKQSKLVIPLCCDDAFDPLDTITTALGSGGEVDNAELDLTKDMLELSILFDPNEGLIDNAAPEANNDNVSTYMNTAIDVEVLSNDNDIDGTIDPNTVEVFTNPIHGTATVNPDGSIKYTPANDYIGGDSFTYRFKDNFGEYSNIGSVSINVLVTAKAFPDTYKAFAGETKVINAPGVLANDLGAGKYVSGADGNSANGGAVAVTANGKVTYTPLTGFTGADTFDYQMQDSNGFSSTAQVTMNVVVRQMVYVKIVQTLVQTQPFYTMCSGVNTLVGRRELSDVTLQFFSDAAGTIPFDIDGYDLDINIRRHTVDNHTGGTIDLDFVYRTLTGTEALYLDNGETHRSLYGCDGAYGGYDFDDTYSLRLGSHYTII